MAAQGADSLGVATLTLTADPAPLDAMLASSEKRTAMSMERMERLTGKRVATVGQNMSRLGNQWTRTVSLPIIGGGAAMVKVAADFEGALTQVQTQAGASGREIEGMRKAILKLAPAVGQTPVNLANALFHIESAGLRGSKALDALTQSARLAQIGHSDLTETTNALVAVMKSAPKDVKNATDAIGLMNATVGAGNLRMGDLVGALSTGIIPSAKAAGLGLRDVGAAIDVMTARGVPATDAATRLRMTISLLAAPTSKAAGELKGIGLSSTQLAMDMRKPDGLVIAIQDLKSHLEGAGLSAVQQNQVIAHAFGGGRSSAGILTLLQNVGALQTAFTGIGKHSGADQVSKSWDKTQEDIGFKLDKLKAQASTAFVDIGTKIAPEFIKIGGEVAADVEKVANAFTSLPKGAQDVIITGALTAAALGPALRLAGVLTTFVGRTWDALKVATALVAGERGLMGGPTSRALSGVGAAGAAGTGVAAAERGASVGGIFSRVVGGVGLAALAAPLGIALGVAVNGWIRSHALDEGRAWADKFTSPLPAAVQNRFRDSLARARQAQEDQPILTLRDRGGAALSRFGRVPPSALAPPSRADQRRTFNQFFNEGRGAGLSTVAGLQSVKFTSAPILTRDFIGQLQKLPARARPEAAKVMISFAQELERQGKLPKRSVDSIIATLEQQFPQLGRFLARQGLTNDRTFAEAMKFNAATKQLKRTLSDYRNNFGDWSVSSKITAQNIDDNVAKAMRHLRDSVAGSTGDARRKYKAELDTMKHATNQTFDAMAGKVDASAKAMHRSIQQGSQAAARDARTNFDRFEGAVNHAMNKGILDTGQGARLITRALNNTLKSFGSKVVAEPGLIAQLPGPGGQHAALNAAAGGGVFPIGRPGTPGRDTIPMSVGGQDIMVGEGETAVVFNRHQMPEANARFADVGGLPGFFSRRKRPNYMATGGYVYPFPPGTTIGRTDEGVDANMPVGSPIGAIGDASIKKVIPNWFQGQPIMTWQLTDGPRAGRYVYLAEQINQLSSGNIKANQAAAHYAPSGTGIEMGWGTPGGLPLASSHYSEGQVTAEGQDFRNFITGLAHGVIQGGTVGGALKQILPPKVRGTGTIATMVRGALRKAADAANKYEAAHAPAPSMTGGSFGLPTGISGGVERQIFEALTQLGWNKIAVAGAIGNAVQESDLNPSALGGGAAGLWQWTPASKLTSGRPDWQSVAVQAQKMTQEIGRGGVNTMNRQGSPAAAAAWLMSNWERPAVATENLARRVAGANQAFAQGYAGGGILPAFGHGGIAPEPPRVVSVRPQPGTWVDKKGKHHKVKPKPKKPKKLPPFKPLPGFVDQGLLDQAAAIDTTVVPDLSNVEGYLQARHGVQQVQALVTLADGTQVVNWDGMIDPSTGQFAKGIHQRLAEIGDPGPNPNATATRDLATELGVDEQILDAYLRQQGLAGQAFPPFQKFVADKQADQKAWQQKIADMNATIARIEELKSKLPQQKKDEMFSLTERFKQAKHRVSTSSSRSSFRSSDLLSEQRKELSHERAAALAGVPTAPPSSWKGSRKAWADQRHRERTRIAGDFSARETALSQAASDHRHAGSLQRSGALFALTSMEDAEKHKLDDDFSARTNTFKDTLGSDKDWLGRFTRYLQSDTDTLSTALGSGGTLETLKAYLDPQGTLAVSNIATTRDVTIPGLLQERADLLGTTVPPVTSNPTTDQLLALTQQFNQNLQQQLEVSRLQYRVLAEFPPFGGSFLTGGMVPGALGEPRTIIAHGGETIAPAGAGGDLHETHVHIDRKGDLEKLIDVRIDHRTRDMARGAKPLPGARAGQLGRR